MSGVLEVAIFGVRIGVRVWLLVSLDENCKECIDVKGPGILGIVKGCNTRRQS